MNVPTKNFWTMTSMKRGGMANIAESIGGNAGSIDGFAFEAHNFYYSPEDGEIQVFYEGKTPRDVLSLGHGTVTCAHDIKSQLFKLVHVDMSHGNQLALDNMRETIRLYNEQFEDHLVQWYRSTEPKLCTGGVRFSFESGTLRTTKKGEEAAIVPHNGAITIGRSSENDIEIPEEPKPGEEGHNAILRERYESVSRRHAELRIKGDDYFVKDLGSTNGTNVFGLPIGDCEYPLERLSFVSLGGYNLFFE
ncbi:MAG: FHA domain-containing protein [Candidatus Aenigmarchaeota archaeon]|nr:FHA domain-containing protein [Candidatus Aenigmarchaeota archaeon]